MKNIQIPEINDFSYIVSHYSNKYKITELVYLEAINSLKRRKLSELNESDTWNIFYPFLLKWGRMGRVIGRVGCDKIRKKIVELNEPLEKYRDIDLRNFEINEEKEEIKKIYTQIKNTKAKNRLVGPTATSKSLHIINPDLFPMWDNTIRYIYGLQNGRALEYIEFMNEQKRWLSNANFNLTVEGFANKYHISKLKVLDQYNWFIANQ